MFNDMKTRLRVGMMLRRISVDHSWDVTEASVARICLVFGIREGQRHEYSAFVSSTISANDLLNNTLSATNVSTSRFCLGVFSFSPFLLSCHVHQSGFPLSLSLSLGGAVAADLPFCSRKDRDHERKIET